MWTIIQMMLQRDVLECSLSVSCPECSVDLVTYLGSPFIWYRRIFLKSDLGKDYEYREIWIKNHGSAVGWIG